MIPAGVIRVYRADGQLLCELTASCEGIRFSAHGRAVADGEIDSHEWELPGGDVLNNPIDIRGALGTAHVVAGSNAHVLFEAWGDVVRLMHEHADNRL
jgi:hypothetical protein